MYEPERCNQLIRLGPPIFDYRYCCSLRYTLILLFTGSPPVLA